MLHATPEPFLFSLGARSVLTGMVHAGLDPVLGCAIAGVKSIDCFIGCMRADLSDKTRAFLAIGPF